MILVASNLVSGFRVRGFVPAFCGAAVLAVLGAATEEGLTVRDAGELRVKETDRIRTVVENLRRLGVEAEERADAGARRPGVQPLPGE